MAIHVRHVLLIGVVLLGVLLTSTTPASALTRHEDDDDEGFFDAVRHKIASLWPFGHKMGDDWEDTQDKVDEVYEKSHEHAKDRVDSLKEDSMSDIEIQNRIAEIYQEEALKAERKIEALKHSMTDKLTSWMHFRGREPTLEEKKGLLERWGLKHKTEEVLPKHFYDETTKKIGETYRSALDQAKSTLSGASDSLGSASDRVGSAASEGWSKAEAVASKAGSAASDGLNKANSAATDGLNKAGSAATHGWKATKAKANKAYSQAFHRGWFESRGRFGQFRDLMGRPFKSNQKSFVRKTVDLLWSFFSSGALLVFGAGGVLGLLRLWNMTQSKTQLNANVAGSVIQCGEYYVVGDEAEQKKFFDFWSVGGPAYAYFSRQPGLKKYWMHRGVNGGERNWMSYSEWASIEDLRRASESTEFKALRTKSPGHTIPQVHIYQLASSNTGSGESQPYTFTSKETDLLRQRAAIASTTSS